MPDRPVLAYTAFALAMICFVGCGAQGLKSHRAVIALTTLPQEPMNVCLPVLRLKFFRALDNVREVLVVR